MNTVKRIISVILCFAIVITSFVPCANAVDAENVLTCLNDYLGNLQNGINDYTDAIGANDEGEYQWVASINPVTGYFYIYDLLTGLTYDEYLSDIQDAYVSDVQTTLGTTQVGTSGYIIWWPSVLIQAKTSSLQVYSSSFGDVTVLSILTAFGSGAYDNYIRVQYGTSALLAPVAGYYTRLERLSCTENFTNCFTVPFDTGIISTTRISKSAGQELFPADYRHEIYPYASYKDGSISFALGVYVEPTTYAINDFTTSVGGGAGRLGNVPITFATSDGSGNYTPVENTYIVNEGENKYYDIVNNVTYDMSSYTYDYSTRTYEVTYVDNDSVTQTTNVTYGDEYITVVQGSNTYNYYYIVTDSGSGGAEDPTEVIGWLEKIHDVLAGILYAVTGIDVIGTNADKPTFWDNLTSGIGSALGNIAEGIGSAIKTIIEALGSLISEFIARIVNFILNFLDKIFDFITDDVLSAAGGFWDAFSDPEGPLGFYGYDDLISPSLSPTVTP